MMIAFFMATRKRQNVSNSQSPKFTNLKKEKQPLPVCVQSATDRTAARFGADAPNPGQNSKVETIIPHRHLKDIDVDEAKAVGNLRRFIWMRIRQPVSDRNIDG